LIYYRTGAQSILGGAGDDTLALDATYTPNTFNLASASVAGIEFFTFESQTSGFTFFGSAGNQTITGGLGADSIDLKGGSDFIFASAGSDSIEYYSGLVFEVGSTGFNNDHLMLTYQTSTLDLSTLLEYGQSRQFFVNASTRSSGATILGGSNDWGDSIRGSDFGDSIFGIGGNDFIDGRDGADTLNAGSGRDSIYLGDSLGTPALVIGTASDTVGDGDADLAVFSAVDADSIDFLYDFTWGSSGDKIWLQESSAFNPRVADSVSGVINSGGWIVNSTGGDSVFGDLSTAVQTLNNLTSGGSDAVLSPGEVVLFNAQGGTSGGSTSYLAVIKTDGVNVIELVGVKLSPTMSQLSESGDIFTIPPSP